MTSLFFALLLPAFAKDSVVPTCDYGALNSDSYVATKIECVDPKGATKPGFPPDAVEVWIKPSYEYIYTADGGIIRHDLMTGRLRLRSFRKSEGIEYHDSNMTEFRPIGRAKNVCKAWEYFDEGGHSCFSPNCNDRIGVLTFSKSTDQFSYVVPSHLADLCRNGLDARITLTQDPNPLDDKTLLDSSTKGTAPLPPRSDEDAKDGSPFIRVARYSDGSLQEMLIESAKAFCANPRFVEQPAHLPTAFEMLDFAVARGAVGIIGAGRRADLVDEHFAFKGNQGSDCLDGYCFMTYFYNKTSGGFHIYDGANIHDLGGIPFKYDRFGFAPLSLLKGNFWTSSKHGDRDSYYYDKKQIYMDLNDGQLVSSYYLSKAQKAYVGCVAGPSPAAGAVSFTPVPQGYRDPSGLIWSPGTKMSQAEATRYCHQNGFRLPTRQEFEQLAKDLGDGKKYEPVLNLQDGSKVPLPGDNNTWFWSSTLYSNSLNQSGAEVFSRLNGVVFTAFTKDEKLPVLCVSGASLIEPSSSHEHQEPRFH